MKMYRRSKHFKWLDLLHLSVMLWEQNISI